MRNKTRILSNNCLNYCTHCFQHAFFCSITQIFLNALRFQQGLYGSVVGSILYTFLGTCKEISMGPTAIVSLMTYNTLRGLGPVYGTILCFLSGFIQVTTGLMGLGKQRRLVVVKRPNSIARERG